MLIKSSFWAYSLISKDQKKKKKWFRNFFFCQLFISDASTSTFMRSDGYQIIQERTTSIIIQGINHNPSYNDKNGRGNSRGDNLHVSLANPYL